jgi:hypothetical protein
VRRRQHSFTSGACADAEPKIYTQITDMAALVRVMEEYLEDYNSITTSPMRLVTFLDAAEHVARVARILRTPLGHALLLGVGGSGRRSLARLGAHVEEYELREIEITKSYGPAGVQLRVAGIPHFSSPHFCIVGLLHNAVF